MSTTARRSCGASITVSTLRGSPLRSAAAGPGSHLFIPKPRRAPASLRRGAVGASAVLGDLRRTREEILDSAYESVTFERLRHHVADPESRERLLGKVGHGSEEEHWNVHRRRAAPQKIEHVDPIESGHRDIQDQKIGTCCG